jgi:hypothetical protein
VPADRLRHGEGPAQVDVHDPVVFLERVGLGLHALVHARHAHQRVDAAVLLQHAFDQPVHVLRLRHVADLRGHRMAALRDLLRGLADGVGLAAGDDHLGVALGESLGQRAADAAAAAGDEDDLAFDGKQLVLHFVFLLFWVKPHRKGAKVQRQRKGNPLKGQRVPGHVAVETPAGSDPRANPVRSLALFRVPFAPLR